MRIVLAVLIWVGIVGGLTVYMDTRREPSPVEAAAVRAAPDFGLSCALEITTTFDLQPDPFALRLDDASRPGLLIRLGSQIIFDRPEDEAGGRVFNVDALPGLKAGLNEFYVEASPPAGNFREQHGVRIQLNCGGQTLADETFWADGGRRVSGIMRVDLDAPEEAAP